MPEVQDLYKNRIEMQSQKLARYEQVKRFTLLSGEFSQAGGELTPTLKLRRKQIVEKYASAIDAMYTA